MLALTTKDPEPFAHVQTYHGFRSKPDITLYQGCNKWYRQLASAQFKGRNGELQITLGSTSYGEAPTEKVECEGFFQVVHHFSLYLDSLLARERFEWRDCRYGEVKAMRHSSGMKLVRVKTDEVIVVYAKVSCAMKKTGKMKFLNGSMLGNDFQIMAAMSLLSILEVEKRNLERRDRERCASLFQL
ncbi:hypothetical protein EG329_000460 [Mollisiaceae sp. DMI_Dod_QoI]|nr:hypothetical protein EG329_000460 [Helotiales sp. DMI_Dod_QoI]